MKANKPQGRQAQGGSLRESRRQVARGVISVWLEGEWLAALETSEVSLVMESRFLIQVGTDGSANSLQGSDGAANHRQEPNDQCSGACLRLGQGLVERATKVLNPSCDGTNRRFATPMPPYFKVENCKTVAFVADQTGTNGLA